MKNIKNIIHVVSYYPPHLGGMENCAKEIATELAHKGHCVDVFTSTIGANSSREINLKNYRVHYLNGIEVAHTPIIFSLFFNLLKVPKNAIIHLHISQAFTPEIVYLVSKIRKIPYIAHMHIDIDPSGPMGFLLKPYKKYFLKHVLQNATKIMCLSEEQKEIVAKKYNLKKTKMVALKNGVNDSYFINRRIKNKKTPTILFVGRLSSQKNVPRLLRAFSQMKQNAFLRIVGEGEEQTKIQQLITELKLSNVELIGRKNGDDLLNEYRNADIFVLTSDKEGGAPLVLLEALATGLPSVVVNIYGIKELLGDAVMRVSNPSPKNFAIALDKMLSNISLRKEFSQRAKAVIQPFRWENTVSKIEKIYEEVSL